MRFWKGNRADAEFGMPVAEVADSFVKWFRSEPGSDDASRDGLPLERLLRWWLSAPQGLHSAWEDEHGPESFDELWAIVYPAIYEQKEA